MKREDTEAALRSRVAASHPTMDRRRFLLCAAAAPLLPSLRSFAFASMGGGLPAGQVRPRVRPGDPGWPSRSAWERLDRDVGGRLIRVHSPLELCRRSPDGPACRDVFDSMKNPFYIGDEPALTQTSGWIDAWTSRPSIYAVAARDAEDVAAAVNFAREHHLRLVVKGGGHSYQGTSDAPDSLLVWTRHMGAITLHDAFVGRGCQGRQAPQPAVSIEAGAMWIDVYDAVTTKAGRYVQGGGCATVGVAGLVQSGGFGSFSKRFGLAAAGLLEAEVVTADGEVRIANACSDPELFWALKGGGGGSLGVVTRVTLRTRELPEHFGSVEAKIRATSPAAFRDLLARFVGFHRDALLNPHWGESVKVEPDDTLTITMVSQGLDTDEARAVWAPFFEVVARMPEDFAFLEPPVIASGSARHWWDTLYRKERAPRSIVFDPRPGAPATHAWWTGDSEQVGVYLHGYESAWLPSSLLRAENQPRLVDALFAASRHWRVQLHFNKGLAGAPEPELDAARDTAMNPAVLDAFALAIIAAGQPPAFPGIPGHEPDRRLALDQAVRVARAADELRRRVPAAGAYVSESSFFQMEWQNAFWGRNYARLRAVKRRYDPTGLFFVHHGVGSEEWSDDGFTPR